MHGVLPELSAGRSPVSRTRRRRRRPSLHSTNALPPLPAARSSGHLGHRCRHVEQLVEAVRRRADALAMASTRLHGASNRPGTREQRLRAAPPEVVEAIGFSVFDELLLPRLKQDAHCVICCTDFDIGDELARLPGCEHFFHRDCIRGWLSRAVTCPLCRRNLAKAVGCHRIRCPAALVAQRLADRMGAVETFSSATSTFLHMNERAMPLPQIGTLNREL